MFTLEKWYLDLVTDDGTAVVGYVGDVAWQGISLRYASCLVAAPGQVPIERTSRGEAGWPDVANGAVSWTSDPLALHGEWHALAAPIARTLLTSPLGVVDWSCVAPRARVAIVSPSGRFEGLGYAERLRLTLPPWALPFRTLRWGRHVSDRHALVWIEWDGGQSMRVAWLDGEIQPSARVTASGVTGLTGHRQLRWDEGRDLSRRPVGALLGRVAPALAARVAGRLATMQEHKQLSRSSLVDADGGGIDRGWTIHEVVTW